VSAQIGYRSILSAANVTATAGTPGHPLRAIFQPNSWETYQPSSTSASLVVDAGSPTLANYIGIAGYGFQASQAAWNLAYSNDGVNYVPIVSKNSVSDAVIFEAFSDIVARYWRLLITGLFPPHICSIYLGELLTMERSIYGGHSPLLLSGNSEIRHNVSESGQWLGKTLERFGTQTAYSFRNISADWYRANMIPFVDAARTKPFFIRWKPTYSEEAAYAWLTSDVEVSNSGQRDLMELSFEAESLQSYGELGLMPSGVGQLLEVGDENLFEM
jgi:hypothetical protein